MSPVNISNASVSQVYNGVQRPNAQSNKGIGGQPSRSEESGFRLPSSATPRGDWVLSEKADPQNFEAGSPRGTYLNVVV